MTLEDEEFNRIEREAKLRAVFDQLPEAIPFITAEQLQQLLSPNEILPTPSDP